MKFIRHAKLIGLLVLGSVGFGCWKIHHDAASRAGIPLLSEAFDLVRVTDGDTIVVRASGQSEIKVRLLGIDSPEKDQPYGSQATVTMKELVTGQTLHLAPHGHDRYGRLLAHVYAGSIWVNLEMVRRGGAWVYRAQRDFSWDELNKAESTAKSARTGLWASPDPIYPGDWRKR